METSKFAYTSDLPFRASAPSASAENMYAVTWYAKDELPADTWDTKSNAGGGWHRYTRKLERNSPQIKALQTKGEAAFYSAMFPSGAAIYNATVDSPSPAYVRAGGRDAA